MWPAGSVTLPWYQPRPCPLLYLFEDLLMTIMRWCTLHSFFPISNHMHAYHVRCLSWLYLNICYEFDQKINLLCWEKVSVALINPVVPYSTVCNPDLRGAGDARVDFTLSAASRVALVHKVPCSQGVSLGLKNTYLYTYVAMSTEYKHKVRLETHPQFIELQLSTLPCQLWLSNM